MHPLSNTREGLIQIPAAAANLGEGLLALLDAAGKAALATPSTAAARFIVVDSDANYATLCPLEPGRQIRVKLTGDCNPGDELVATADSKAAARSQGDTLPTVLHAEEAGADGQMILARAPVAVPAAGPIILPVDSRFPAPQPHCLVYLQGDGTVFPADTSNSVARFVCLAVLDATHILAEPLRGGALVVLKQDPAEYGGGPAIGDPVFAYDNGTFIASSEFGGPILAYAERRIDEVNLLWLCRVPAYVAAMPPNELPSLAGIPDGYVLGVADEQPQWTQSAGGVPIPTESENGFILSAVFDCPPQWAPAPSGLPDMTGLGPTYVLGVDADTPSWRSGASLVEMLEAIVAALPTSNPYDPGKLYVDGDTIKISAGI